MRWLVAVVVAGCAAAPRIDAEPAFDASAEQSGGSGGNAQGGAPGGGSAGVPSGGAGGAGGAPVGVTVTAKCETVVGSTLWAVAGFPGKSADDLLRVVAWRDAAPEDYAPAGLTRRVIGSQMVGDGKAGAICGFVGAGGAAPQPVTFVLPP